jgi:HTH-type transcriptional regulator/antitoxin MqsA
MGILTVGEFTELVREILNLTQQCASEIFGGGINAFSRYERGETPIPRSLSQLLLLLYNHPEMLKEINVKNRSPKRHQKISAVR